MHEESRNLHDEGLRHFGNNALNFKIVILKLLLANSLLFLPPSVRQKVKGLFVVATFFCYSHLWKDFLM